METNYKLFCATDPHLKRVDPLGIIEPDGRNTRLKDKIGVLSTFVETALKENATHIVFLGDIYDAVNPPEFLRREFWNSLHTKNVLAQDIKIIILIGNHDTTGSISNFAGEEKLLPKNITIVKDNYLIESLGSCGSVVYVPYAKKEVLAKWFAEIKEKYGKATALFGHFEIEGAELGPDNAKIQEGFPKEMVSELASIVWLGHIHKFQEFRPGFAYLGSMVKCDFGEVNNKKVYGVLAIEQSASTKEINIEPKYVEIPQRPMYQIALKEDDPNSLYLAETIPKELLAPGVLIKLVLEGGESWISAIDKQKFKKRFPKALRIFFEHKKIDSDRQKSEITTSNIIDRVYAKVKEKNKDKEHLDTGLLIAKEVQEVEL